MPENGQGPLETGIPFDGKRDQVDQRRDPHRRHPSHQHDDTRNRGACDCPRDRDGHHEHRPDLFRFLRNQHELCALRQWLVSKVVLNGVSDFVGGDCNRRQGFTIEDFRCQTNCFADRIIVIAYSRRLHDDVLKVESIEQVSG